ncbi:MAG: flagellar hook-associated protein FlgL [Bacteroidetes bacterium]|nr:flagellar hook-associated protein FlgL [Bacteroidota bacterium]
MRISDVMLQSSFINNLNRTKEQLAKMQEQSITGKKVLRPSDNPSSSVTILSLQKQISNGESYLKNLDYSKGFITESESNLNVMEYELSSILSNMTLSSDPTAQGNLNIFAEQIDLSLQSMLDAANASFDGKYLFGGTDFSAKPYDLTSDGASVEVKTSGVGGEQKISFSQNITQKLNVTGTELFGTIVKQSGSLDSGAANGTIITDQKSIFNAEGTEFTLKTSYGKTADNTWNFTYDIEDGTNTSIFGTPPTAKSLVFDSSSGVLKTVNGVSPDLMNIRDSSNKIDFNIDLRSLKEASAPAISMSANQENDIFNVIIKIRDNLKNGILPTGEQLDQVQAFHKHLLNKLSQNGNIYNQIENTQELWNNRIFNLQDLYSKEQDVDQTKLIIDMQSQDNQLQIAYKLSSMILPKSLLDYL